MDKIFALIGTIITALWPPRDMTGDSLRKWAITITVVSMANLFGAGMITAVALGYGAMAGIPGVATADTVDGKIAPLSKTLADVNATLVSLQRGQLDQKLRDLDTSLIKDRTQFCVAEKAGNADAKAFAIDRFRADYKTYFDLSGGQSWRIPDCSELI